MFLCQPSGVRSVFGLSLMESGPVSSLGESKMSVTLPPCHPSSWHHTEEPLHPTQTPEASGERGWPEAFATATFFVTEYSQGYVDGCG